MYIHMCGCKCRSLCVLKAQKKILENEIKLKKKYENKRHRYLAAFK